jgi:multiple sugar transport system permease protein
MLIYLAGLQNIPRDLYEAAALDGLGPIQSFRYITWPLLRKITAVVFILLVIACLNVFQEVFVMTGGASGKFDGDGSVPDLQYGIRVLADRPCRRRLVRALSSCGGHFSVAKPP